VYATDKTGSSSDDWIYYQVVTHSLLITLIHRLYSALSHLHQLKFTVAHALGFSVHTSRFRTTVSLTLQALHISLLSTEALFTSHAVSSYLTAHTSLVLHFTTSSSDCSTYCYFHTYSDFYSYSYCRCTAFGLSYKRCNLTSAEVRDVTEVTLAKCGATRSEGKGGEARRASSATVAHFA
jgi:hypothetical protein